MKDRKSILKRFELSFKFAISSGIALYVFAYLIEKKIFNMPFFDTFILIVWLLCFLCGLVYLYYLGEIVAELNKSILLWVGGCFVIPFFFIYAYFQIKNQAIMSGW